MINVSICVGSPRYTSSALRCDRSRSEASLSAAVSQDQKYGHILALQARFPHYSRLTMDHNFSVFDVMSDHVWLAHCMLQVDVEHLFEDSHKHGRCRALQILKALDRPCVDPTKEFSASKPRL